MNELWTALYSRLTAATAVTVKLASTTSVYDSGVPQGASYPLIVFQQQAGGFETVDPHSRHDKLVTVKAITADGFKTAEEIDAAILAALDNNKLSVTGHTNIWQRRTSDVRYAEADPAGNAYYHVGGIYRLRLTH